jgi:hypothetical protein
MRTRTLRAHDTVHAYALFIRTPVHPRVRPALISVPKWISKKYEHVQNGNTKV